MAKPIQFTSSQAGPWYAYPGSEPDFTNWVARRVAASGSADRWTVSVDDVQYGPVWYLFQGATAPTSWHAAEAVADAGGLTAGDVLQIRYRLGLNGDTQTPTPPVTNPVVIVPSPDPAVSVGYTTTRTGQGTLAPTTTVFFQLVESVSGDGNHLKSDKISLTSDAQSLLEGYFLRGATYLAWRRKPREKVQFVVPDVESFELPEIID